MQCQVRLGNLAAVDRRAPRAIARLPHPPGVYRFRDGAGAVLYIGRAAELRSRVGSYWSGLRDRGHLAPMVGPGSARARGRRGWLGGLRAGPRSAAPSWPPSWAGSPAAEALSSR
jgi:hypothetical protein